MEDGKFQKAAAKIGALVEEKNKSYGDSFAQCSKILQVLYPNGVRPDQYMDMLGTVRVLDKLFRIANQKGAFGESPWQDVAGYGILGMVNDGGIMPDELGETAKKFVTLGGELSVEEAMKAVERLHEILGPENMAALIQRTEATVSPRVSTDVHHNESHIDDDGDPGALPMPTTPRFAKGDPVRLIRSGRQGVVDKITPNGIIYVKLPDGDTLASEASMMVHQNLASPPPPEREAHVAPRGTDNGHRCS